MYNLLLFLFIVALSFFFGRGKTQLLFAVCAFIALAPLNLTPITVALALSLVFIVLERYYKDSGIILIGLITPLVPAFGMGTLLAAILIMLAVYKDGKDLLALGKAFPFLVIVFCWIILESIVDISNTQNWFKHFGSLPPESFTSAADGIRLLLIIVLFNLFKTKERAILRGFVYGMTISAVIILATLCFPILEHLLPNQSALWDSIKRHTGTFTDPNAFGLFAALSLPLLVYSGKIFERRYDYILALFWVALGCFSGSRSFILALCFYAAIGVFLYSKKIFTVLALIALAVWGAGTSLSNNYPEKFQEYEAKLPRSLERVSQAAFSQCIDSTVYSRRVFWGINLDMIKNPPQNKTQLLTGQGFNQYEKYFPYYLEKSGINLGVWRDSPNNFYLGLIIELGVIGFILFLFAVSEFRFVKEDHNRMIPRIGVFMLGLILLFFGPHLHFDELIVIVALLLALACEKRCGEKCFICKRVMKPCCMPSFLSICYLYLAFLGGTQHLFLDHGAYPLESDSNGKFRWTDGKVEFLLSPEKKDLDLGLRHNNIEKNPIGICVDEICSTTTNNQKQSINLENCNPVELLGKKYCKHTIQVTDTWIPAELLDKSTDRRRLGVKLRY